ncbi:hypothetical protein LJK87_07325 [Paenibacillus sp. P25]|nr:hypothetical protein LJK87_07325 [Paenibacillus sp. P25]
MDAEEVWLTNGLGMVDGRGFPANWMDRAYQSYESVIRLYSAGRQRRYDFGSSRVIRAPLKFRYTIPILKFKTWLKGIELKSEKVNKNEADLLQDQKQNITVDKIRQAFENAKLLIAHCFGFNSWLEGTLSKIRCTSVVWKTSIGIGDAPETAFVVGLLWSLKSSLAVLCIPADPPGHPAPASGHACF